MTTLVFMLYSAPDVAKTLLLVETLMVVFVVLLIRHIPGLLTVPQHSVRRRLLHGVIAGVIGMSVTALLINITAQPLDSLWLISSQRIAFPAGMDATSLT
uniref:hydrogenase subunit MbhD domain-containing protein n=1 Tax=Vibrio alfacsensis TaxID=1074311 RepID=UPI001F494853|nr:hydrogenase subunit MbhD domain-containing protein [Vibrio alfacsensis]